VARAFREQLRNLKSGQVDVAPQARHFLMYDDPQWMFEKMDRFLGQPPGGIENRAKVH
jgi:hypothetical protein